jgi:hypothetical protein
MADIRSYRDSVEYFKHVPLDSSGYQSDDLGWSDRVIVEHLLDVRTSEIKQRQLVGIPIDKHNEQTLPCIELEEVDAVDCPCPPPSGCIWLKSNDILPRMISLTSVSSIDGSINFNPVDWTKLKYKVNSRIKSNQKKKYYTTRDTGEGTYLYILNDDFLKAVSLTAIFEDPYCAFSFPKCGEQNIEALCNPWNVDIKTDRSIFEAIIRKAWQILLSIRSAAGSDTYNDSQDNTKNVIQPKF